MFKKKNLLIAWALYSYTLLFYDTIKFICGKADMMDMIYISLCYGILLLIAITKMITKTMIKIAQYRAFKSYKDKLKYLQAIHKMRYKLYFTGTRDEGRVYSEEIKNHGGDFIKAGEEAISLELFNKQKTEQLKEMLNQVKILMTTEKHG